MPNSDNGISILCPTRGRPQKLKDMMETAMQTATGNVEFVCYIDLDDECKNEYVGIQERGSYPISIIVGERIVLSEMWNRCYEISNYNIGFIGNDDFKFITPNWDGMIKEQFEKHGNLLMVCGQDMIHPIEREFGTYFALHEDLCELVGYFVPPYFTGEFNDTWWNDIMTFVKRKMYLPQLMIKHEHFATGAEVDQTYIDQQERVKNDNMQELYYSKEMMRERMDIARKIMEAMA